MRTSKSLRLLPVLPLLGLALLVPAPGAFAQGGCVGAIWTNGSGDGKWENSANWSTGSAPNSTTDACVAEPGAVVTVTGTQSARNLVLAQVVPQATPPKLVVQADTGGNAQLTADTVQNGGTIELNPAGSGNATLRVNDGGWLESTGTITANANASGSGRPVLDTPQLTNSGTLSTLKISESRTLQRPSGSYSNGGTVEVEPNKTLTVSSGAFTLYSGTLKVDGALVVDGGAFIWNAGAITRTGATPENPPELQFTGNATLAQWTTSTTENPIKFTVHGNTTLEGAVGSTQIQKLEVAPTTGNVVVTANRLSNAGTIDLNPVNEFSATLNVTDTLTNSVGGVINANANPSSAGAGARG